MIFKHFGVDPDKEIKVISLGSAAARLSAERGLVQGVIITPPGDAEAEKMGFNVMARGFESEILSLELESDPETWDGRKRGGRLCRFRTWIT
jgi:hypothetical protein